MDGPHQAIGFGGEDAAGVEFAAIGANPALPNPPDPKRGPVQASEAVGALGGPTPFKKSIRRQQAAAMAPSPAEAHLLIHRFRAGTQGPAGLSRVLGPFGQQAPKGQAHLQPAVFLALQQHGLPWAHLLPGGVIGLQARGPGALEMGQQLPKAGGEGIPVAHGAAHLVTLGLARQPFGSPNPGAIREREERP